MPGQKSIHETFLLLTVTTKQISEAKEILFTSYLKGLSHEMDLAFEDMHVQF
jgi:hypothetical protein